MHAYVGGLCLAPLFLCLSRLTVFQVTNDCKAYNRAGRLALEMAHCLQIAAGVTTMPWDSHHDYTNLVGDGVYLVVVEALGQ